MQLRIHDQLLWHTRRLKIVTVKCRVQTGKAKLGKDFSINAFDRQWAGLIVFSYSLEALLRYPNPLYVECNTSVYSLNNLKLYVRSLSLSLSLCILWLISFFWPESTLLQLLYSLCRFVRVTLATCMHMAWDTRLRNHCLLLVSKLLFVQDKKFTRKCQIFLFLPTDSTHQTSCIVVPLSLTYFWYLQNIGYVGSVEQEIKLAWPYWYCIHTCIILVII